MFQIIREKSKSVLYSLRWNILIYIGRSLIKGERHIEYLNRKFLHRISIWGRLVGVLTMLAGVISMAQSSVIPFYDIISNVITVISGYFLYQTGAVAWIILNGKSDESSGANRIFEKYSYYIQIKGLLFILGIFFILFVFIAL